MTIAITATGPTLEASVDSRFGRCPYFLIVDTDSLDVEPVENPNLVLGHGAGIQSAQLMAQRGVQFVLTGNCGPKAYQTLSAAGIGVIAGCGGTVTDVIEQFKAGQLGRASGATVASKFGVGGPSDDTTAPPVGANPPFGPGMSRRRSARGSRQTRTGRGMGGGRGAGRGMRSGMDGAVPSADLGADDELTALKKQADEISRQAQQIQHRIQELQQETPDGHQD